MPAVVGFLKVGHNQMGALFLGQAEQPHYLIGPLREGEQRLVHVVFPVVGISSLDGHVTAHPIDRGGCHALPLGREPDGVTTVILRVAAGIILAQRVNLARGADFELVRNDAVVVGIEARGQGVVVGERLAGKGRHHHRLDTMLNKKLLEKRGIVGLGVIPTKTVERYDDRVVVIARSQRQTGNSHKAQSVEKAFCHDDSV